MKFATIIGLFAASSTALKGRATTTVSQLTPSFILFTDALLSDTSTVRRVHVVVARPTPRVTTPGSLVSRLACTLPQGLQPYLARVPGVALAAANATSLRLLARPPTMRAREGRKASQ